MRYRGYRNVQEWLAVFRTLKDYPWDVRIYQCTSVGTGEPVNLVLVTGKTPTAATIIHIFAEDYEAELDEFVGSLEDAASRGYVARGPYESIS